MTTEQQETKNIDEALRLLPGVTLETGRRFLVRILKELDDAEAWNEGVRSLILEGRMDGVYPKETSIAPAGVKITWAESSSLFPAGPRGSRRVSPAGAARLVDIYLAGGLPMKPTAAPIANPPLLDFAKTDDVAPVAVGPGR